MKSKILRLMAVGLTLAMVLSLTAIMAVPVAAGENEWSSPDQPAKEGSAGDWLWDSTITEGPGPMAMAIDGTLWVFAEVEINTVAEYHLFSSSDGREWDKSDYHKDVDGGIVVDIAVSSLDADTLYVTDGSLVYYTKDGGGKWEEVGDASLITALGGAATGFITSVDVSYDDDEAPYVFIGTTDSAALWGGSVFYICQSGYPAQWTDLRIDLATYAVAASPEFADTGEIFAVSSNGTDTHAYSNVNGEVGGWDVLAELLDDDDAAMPTAAASRICFPDDFDDDNYEFFVGIDDGDYGGSVYRVDDDHAYCLGKEDSDIKDKDIVSLDIVGSYGDTMLIAGTWGGDATGTDNKVIVSLDDGDSWDDASKEPSGDGATWVVFDPDFADNGTAYVACDGLEGAVSLTLDEGDLWNQISMICTAIDAVDSLSFSRNWATDETWFLLTSDTDESTDSLWRYDGSNWERVFVSTLTTPDLGAISKVQVSVQFPTDETVCVVESGPSPIIYRSTDGGTDWDDLSNNPDELNAWIVISSDTIVAGGDGEVYYTNNHGRRAWETEIVDDLGVATAFSMSPNFGVDDTLLLGDIAGQVFISEDIGESWDQVGDDLETTAATIVAFDIGYGSNGTIYAASGDEVNRCVIDTDDEWGDQEWKEFTTALTDLDMGTASGLVCSADGTLYAVDGTTANATAGVGGVWRALNPTESTLGNVQFELVGGGFELDDGAELTGLRVTYGSNILWCLDSAVTHEVWQYEDMLATEVVLDTPWSNSGLTATDEVTLKWNELTGADFYELRYTDDVEWKENVAILKSTDDLDETFKWIDGLDDGTKYYWKVRVQQDEPLLSRWSKVWNFTTALDKVAVPVTWEPENGAQGVIIRPSFGWTAVGGASSYNLELADNPDFTGATKATTSINSWVADTDLSYNTTYYWRVKALKDSIVLSGWRSGAFVTMSKPAAPVEVTPAPPAPQITIPAPQVILPAAVTPMWVWAIIAIGAALVIAVIVLIIRTRRAL